MGWASEFLIGCGSYFIIQGNNLGYALLALGIFGASVRFGVSVGRGKIKDDILGSLHEILKGITSITKSLDSEELNAKQPKTTIH